MQTARNSSKSHIYLLRNLLLLGVNFLEYEKELNDSSFFHLSNIDLTTPLSINVANMFFKTIKLLALQTFPIIPINFKPCIHCN